MIAAQREAEQCALPLDDRQHGVQQAHRVQGQRDPQKHNVHERIIAHGSRSARCARITDGWKRTFFSV